MTSVPAPTAILDNVRERDLDLLVSAHLWASESFRHWLLRQILKRNTQHKLRTCQVSQTTDAGETDILLQVVEQNGSAISVMIENKIDAQFQPNQAARYQQRGQHGIDEGAWHSFRTCLLAPQAYIDSLAPSHGWDARVALEDIATWNRSSGTPHDLVLAAICEQAVTKQSRTSASISPTATAFWKAYSDLARELLPNLMISRLKANVTAASPWPRFGADRLGEQILLDHKPQQGRIDITCYSTSVEDVWDIVSGCIPNEAHILKFNSSSDAKGSSSVVRMLVPRLDHLAPFSEQEKHVRVALAAVGRMFPVAMALRDQIRSRKTSTASR